jgi:hypothetical protein
MKGRIYFRIVIKALYMLYKQQAFFFFFFSVISRASHFQGNKYSPLQSSNKTVLGIKIIYIYIKEKY